MPREITILTLRPVTDAEVLQTATEAVPDMGVRRIQPGALLQFATTGDDGVEIVLTMGQPSALRAPGEIERLHPGATLSEPLREALAGSAAESGCVWIEATAPATRLGLVGTEICQTLAERTGGTCLVQDGR